VTICLAVLIEYRRVKDRQTDDGPTDRQTDILRQHIARYAYASRGKNVYNIL